MTYQVINQADRVVFESEDKEKATTACANLLICHGVPFTVVSKG